MKRLITLGLLGILVVLITALVVPASALECGETFVDDTMEERVRVLELSSQTVMVVHGTRTYTVEGDTRPFFRFVSSFVDRNYVDRNGDTNDFRAGLDEGFIGHYSHNLMTGQEAWNGQETLTPDEQACAILAG